MNGQSPATTTATLAERLAAADLDIDRVRAEGDGLTRRLHEWLLPAVVRRRAECEHLRQRLAHLRDARRELTSTQQRLLHLESSLAVAKLETQALRESLSWRITAPLRFVYGWVAGVRRFRR